MKGSVELRGLCTISLWADDVPAAVKWYSELFGMKPYFVRPEEGAPQYVEFRLGDYQHELGIIDKNSSRSRRSPAPAESLRIGTSTTSMPHSSA